MAQPTSQPTSSKASAKLLVVEDDAMVRDFCVRALRMNGYQVATAENGRVAVGLLGQQRFDVVLTDLQMPEMHGIELIEYLRKNYPDIDTIAFTAYATVDTARQALKLGAFEYLTKPVSVEDLERTVRKCIELQRIRREKERLSEVVAMYEFSQTIAASLDTDAQVGQIIKLLRQRFAPQAVSLSLFYPDEPELRLLGQNGVDTLRATSKSISRDQERNEQVLIEAHLSMIDVVVEEEGGRNAQEVLRTNHRPVGVLRLVRGPEQPDFDADERRLLAVFASQIAASLDNARLYEQLKEQNLQTVTALANAIEARDPYTRGHSEQVMRYAVRMMEVIGQPHERVELMRYAGLLHDIGKIGIRDQILLKPAALNDDEFAVMKQHPTIGGTIVRSIRSLQEALPIIEGHHERVDGRGYPDGLNGSQITLEARILAIADSFEAMTSDRAYRKGMPVDVALQTLIKGRGTQWDAELVDTFVDMIQREIDELRMPAESRTAQVAVVM